ncbi:MAG: DUF3592 domain-containing protein [Devosia sp.]
MSLAFLVGAVFLVWGWLAGDTRAAALADRGVNTTGTVVSVTETASIPSRYDTKSPARYFVTHSFMDSIGTPRERVTGGASESYASFAPGQRIAVRYLPNNPEISVYARAAPAGSRRAPLTMLALLLGCAAFFGYSAFTGFRAPTAKAPV